MPTHTGQGDDGRTDLPSTDGRPQRVGKDHPTIEALGTLDELSSWLGLCISAAPADSPVRRLQSVQKRIAGLSGELLGLAPPTEEDDEGLAELAELVRTLEAQLPPLTEFVLPGGGELPARVHVARTVCRRAERRVVAAFDLDFPPAAVAVRWLNLLSDLLFILARHRQHRP